jgi:hypothetical protein
MQFIDYNFVSDDVAKNIMESYGYDVPEQDEVVSEDVAAPELPDYVCVVNETTYALCEGVEEVDGQLFIPVMEVNSELHEALAENDTTLLESVEMDDTSYEFGDIFEDEKTGEMFIAINEMRNSTAIDKAVGAVKGDGTTNVNPNKSDEAVNNQVTRIRGEVAKREQRNKEVGSAGTVSPNAGQNREEAGYKEAFNAPAKKRGNAYVQGAKNTGI